MKKYRACTIRLLSPVQNQVEESPQFDSRMAANTHRVIKWNKISQVTTSDKKVTSKKLLGSGSFKTVYEMEGTPPASMQFLNTEYVLAKLSIKNLRENNEKMKIPKAPDEHLIFMSTTISDVVSQMLVSGQKETTIYFSNLNENLAPSVDSYRYCLYQPKLRGRTWGIQDEEAKDNLVFLKQVYSQLHSLHVRGFYHSDIKPTNIMINGSNATLFDFGGLNRIWRDHIVCTQKYFPLSVSGKTGKRSNFWTLLETSLKKFFPGNKAIIDDLNTTFNDFSNAYKLRQKDAATLKPATLGPGTLRTHITGIDDIDFKNPKQRQDSLYLMWGVHMDMGSILMLLADIIKFSCDKNELKFNHKEALWREALVQCFSPPSIAALLSDYMIDFDVPGPASHPFNNFILSVGSITASWDPVYGIDVDSIGTSIAQKDAQRAHKQGIDIGFEPDMQTIRNEVAALSKQMTQKEKDELSRMQHFMFELLHDLSRVEDNSKQRVLAYIRDAFKQTTSMGQLKMLVEKAFYVSLINRSGNFFWGKKTLTETFKILHNSITTRDFIRDPKTGSRIAPAPLLIELLDYPNYTAIGTRDQLYNALRENQKGHEWVFNPQGHTGRFDQIIQCLGNIFIQTSGNGIASTPVTDRNAFRVENRQYLALAAERARPIGLPTIESVVQLDDYEGNTARILDDYKQGMYLNMDIQLLEKISNVVEKMYR